MLTTVIDGTNDPMPAGATQPAARRFSRPFAFTKIGLSALAFGIVASTVDLSDAWQRTAQQNMWLAAGAAGLILVQIAVGGVRWHIILVQLGARLALSDSIRLCYIAAFFNVCLWGAVAGDIVRGWLAYRARVGSGNALNSVVLDRVAALAAVAILVLVTAPLFGARAGHLFAAALATMAAGLLMGIFIVAQSDRLPLDWQRNAWRRAIAALASAAAKIFLRPASAFATLAVAVGAQIAMAMSVYVLAAGLRIDLGLVDCLLLMQPVALITALPISVGGWGTREAAMVGALGLVGVPASAALALSVQLGLLTMIVALPGGILWLLVRDSLAIAEGHGA
jgi:glycosyltransferase 2 family protein